MKPRKLSLKVDSRTTHNEFTGSQLWATQIFLHEVSAFFHLRIGLCMSNFEISSNMFSSLFLDCLPILGPVYGGVYACDTYVRCYRP